MVILRGRWSRRIGSAESQIRSLTMTLFWDFYSCVAHLVTFVALYLYGRWQWRLSSLRQPVVISNRTVRYHTPSRNIADGNKTETGIPITRTLDCAKKMPRYSSLFMVKSRNRIRNWRYTVHNRETGLTRIDVVHLKTYANRWFCVAFQ